MFLKFFSLFAKLNPVEIWAATSLDKLLAGIFSGGFAFKKVTAFFLALAEIFPWFINRDPIKPFGPELDLSGYELVFEDEFEGDELNYDVWQLRHQGPSYKAFFSADPISVHDGSLHIDAGRYENGKYGPGWYAGEIMLRDRYAYGYYECRAICSAGNAFWSAFWLQHENSSQKSSEGGINGAEIDIMEALAENSPFGKGRDCVLQCLHVNGGTDDPTEDVDTCGAIFFETPNYDTEFNTYGVKWTPDEYIFYINGVETMRSSWRDGVSTVPEEVILSVCVPSTTKTFDEIFPADYRASFVVDYVRIYQLAE